MMRIASWSFDLSDTALTRLVQLGVDCVDSVPVPTDDRGVWMVGNYDAVHRGGYTARGDSLGEGDVPAPIETQESHWKKVCQSYERLVPIAEEYGLKLMMHASDPPTADALFGGLNFQRLIDDGDMNMFKILLALKRVGFDGYLHPDHYPKLEGDGPGRGSQSLAYSVGYIKAMLAALACVWACAPGARAAQPFFNAPLYVGRTNQCVTEEKEHESCSVVSEY